MVDLDSLREGQALKAELSALRERMESLSERIESDLGDRERQWMIIAISDVDHAGRVLDDLFG